jgi:hypothetical protein
MIGAAVIFSGCPWGVSLPRLHWSSRWSIHPEKFCTLEWSHTSHFWHLRKGIWTFEMLFKEKVAIFCQEIWYG